METPHFVATPWRSGEELLLLRRCFYDSRGKGGDRRRKAVDRVLAWRVREPELPLLLDSTADIVDAVLQDESGKLDHNALRLVYAAAISRFATGFTDTQLDLRRSRPSWLHPQNDSSSTHTPNPLTTFPNTSNSPSQQTSSPPSFLPFPRPLLETRHNIVHRHLPPLSVLKNAAQDALKWLWEWYWINLDAGLNPNANANSSTHASSTAPAFATSAKTGFGTPRLHVAPSELSDRIASVFRTYIRTRKNELKTSSRAKAAKDAQSGAAATSAVSSLTLISPLTKPFMATVIHALVNERQILPARVKIGENMSGAFLLWTPLLLRLSSSAPSSSFLSALVDALLAAIVSQTHTTSDAATYADEVNPVREALMNWLIHVHTDVTSASSSSLLEDTLQKSFTLATPAHLRVAEALLADKTVEKVLEGSGGGCELWGALLEAAKDEVAGQSQGQSQEVSAGAGSQIAVEVEAEEKAKKGKKKRGKADAEEERQEAADVQMIEVGEETAAASQEVKKVKKAKTGAGKPAGERTRGPRKYVGLWRPQPIGALPVGWEVDSLA